MPQYAPSLQRHRHEKTYNRRASKAPLHLRQLLRCYPSHFSHSFAFEALRTAQCRRHRYTRELNRLGRSQSGYEFFNRLSLKRFNDVSWWPHERVLLYRSIIFFGQDWFCVVAWLWSFLIFFAGFYVPSFLNVISCYFYFPHGASASTAECSGISWPLGIAPESNFSARDRDFLLPSSKPLVKKFETPQFPSSFKKPQSWFVNKYKNKFILHFQFVSVNEVHNSTVFFPNV